MGCITTISCGFVAHLYDINTACPDFYFGGSAYAKRLLYLRYSKKPRFFCECRDNEMIKNIVSYI